MPDGRGERGGRGDRGERAEPGPGGGARPPVALSRAELRVAELAARGRTNRQIAQELFLTVSTVEQHLTSSYRKLGVKRRADLPGHLLPDAPDAPDVTDVTDALDVTAATADAAVVVAAMAAAGT
ncbi:helix-turn-helix transcriptional regulator [Kitasatospora sp. NPDC089913]|uniref:helix-turn-helix domain-containing protein n=1 Tax=Kitasatospora sp. NPDC089913 TaxID=3364080 RepID=UPI0038252D6B